MKQFATYEEENIHYWTNRASGYSTVNQEELASDQKTVWRGVISGRIAARFPDRCPEEIRVLDVGTGPGFFAIILATAGAVIATVAFRFIPKLPTSIINTYATPPVIMDILHA